MARLAGDKPESGRLGKEHHEAKGGSFGLSAGKGHTDAAVVAEQTALVARGGSLEATVNGTTRLDGALIAAVDEAGADSGELRLSTGRLEVSDIADRVDTRQVSAGISTSINDITKSGVAGANTPVLDGSYAGSNFRQETRGTIGAGEVIVADADGGTPLDEINRDIAAAQQVTKDSQSGFTLYLNDSAIRETGALITGDSRNSTILQGAEALATDPLAAAKGLVEEVKSLADDVPESGSLETLGGKVNSLFPGYAERSAKASGRAVEIAMIKAGLTPEQASQGKKYLEAKGVLAAEGELKQALHDAGTERNLPPERIERVAAEIRAFQEKGDISPAARQQLAERIAAVAPEIVVTGQAVNGPFDKVLSLAVKTTEALGEAVNTAPEWMKKGIVAASYVLGGVQGVVTNLATDLSGAGAYLEKGTELLTVGVDSLLRRDSFAQVHGENQNKSSDNPTYNRTTGIGIVGSVILPGVGKAVLKGKGRPHAKPDTPAANHGGTSSGGSSEAVKTVPDKAGEIGADAPPVASDLITQIEPKIEGQMGKRGWDRSSIDETIANPQRIAETRDTRYNPETGSRNDDPATAYINADGSYVVRNNRTGAIVQISDRNKVDWKSPFD